MSGRMLLQAKRLRRSRGRLAGRVRVVQFDYGTRLLQREGVAVVRLSPQEGAVLTLLVDAAPAILSLETLARQLWAPGRPPASALQRVRDLVARLREILGDSANNPCWIENVSGTGYVFVGTVEKTPEPIPPPETLTESLPSLPTALLAEPNPEQRTNADLVNESDQGEVQIMPLTEANITVPLPTENLNQQEKGWPQYWPCLLALPIFAVFGWATWEGAYGLAVFLICLGTGVTVLSYLHLPDTVYTRALTATIALLAMAYIPSAVTLTQIMTTVVNAETLRPALVYPFITGLKFIPLFCLLLGYWTVLALFANEGFRKRPILGKAYLLLGPVCLGTTLILLASASGDWQLWNLKVPGRGILLMGYIFIFAVNVAVWLAGYQFLTREFIPSYRQLLILSGIAYLPVALTGVAVDHQYNDINQYYLDQRRPEAYIAQKPVTLENWRKFVERAHVGPDLQQLLDDPQFRRTLQNERFFKQNFDEPFQVMAHTIMLGYRLHRQTMKTQQPFVIIRFPKELADALEFQVSSY